MSGLNGGFVVGATAVLSNGIVSTSRHLDPLVVIALFLSLSPHVDGCTFVEEAAWTQTETRPAVETSEVYDVHQEITFFYSPDGTTSRRESAGVQPASTTDSGRNVEGSSNFTVVSLKNQLQTTLATLLPMRCKCYTYIAM